MVDDMIKKQKNRIKASFNSLILFVVILFLFVCSVYFDTVTIEASHDKEKPLNRSRPIRETGNLVILSNFISQFIELTCIKWRILKVSSALLNFKSSSISVLCHRTSLLVFKLHRLSKQLSWFLKS